MVAFKVQINRPVVRCASVRGLCTHAVVHSINTGGVDSINTASYCVGLCKEASPSGKSWTLKSSPHKSWQNTTL